MNWELIKASFGSMANDFWQVIEDDARKLGFPVT